MTVFSFYRVAALSTLVVGVILFLVAISSDAWQGIKDGVDISLWNVCLKFHATRQWLCKPWQIVPDFARAAQAFAIIALLCFCVSCIIQIATFLTRLLHDSRVALIVLSLMTFTSACMIVMAVVVMGVKGKDHLYLMKEDNEVIFEYYIKGVVISGEYTIGWSMVLAIVSALLTFISFIFFLMEYRDLTGQIPPTRV